MLSTLYLKNYTLTDELTVTFSSGLSIVTGETGAGKSVIIGALNLIVGERASTSIIRKGASKAIVEAVFNCSTMPSISSWLTLHDYDATEELVIRREVPLQGSTRAFINDTPATIGTLKELGAQLIDLHGQHEHQSLFNLDRHRLYLDDYTGVMSDVNIFGDLYDEYVAIQSEINTFLKDKEKLLSELEFLEFQRNEIANISPQPNEDVNIERELYILENAEEVISITGNLYHMLYEDAASVYTRLVEAKNQLEKLNKLDTNFTHTINEVVQTLTSIKELSSVLGKYSDQVEVDNERLNVLRSRQQAVSRLKKKYGPTLDDVISKLNELESKIGPDSDIDSVIIQKQAELQSVRAKMSTLAVQISKLRIQSAKKFESEIKVVLKELNMSDSIFQVRFETNTEPTNLEVFVETREQKYHASRTGIDKVEFYISTNKGEEPKQLAKVASGGEISRIMLALKSILSSNDEIPTLIFDEIDSGISGKVAQKAGRLMKKLSSVHQVISITHLGQIAAFADTHYLVEKSSEKNTTSTNIRQLDRNEHKEEIARLISGAHITEESLGAASALLKEAGELARS